ncbi:MAG: 16S rRNA (cytosine(1402)-N(4))-methyltransferase RsmH [Candidatus Marinimicrobia bacterium]|nr:16S rRNA (cytosine(1402)-N(4))-methyltransferase RsmH [Candidatus Neomarinimicrobiota bacterium]
MTIQQQDGTPVHLPVMVAEVLSYLNILPDGIYLDGTIGLGGHAKHILSTLQTGRLVGIDRDEEALEICKKHILASSPVSLFHTAYDEFPSILSQLGITEVNGILLDLGLSSLQLGTHERGFSFRNEGPLDMRFDSSADGTAADLIANSSEEELANILYEYGEERHSRKISRAIKKMPVVQTIGDLNEAIRRSTPPAQRHKSQARIYQALRIAVNKELDHLTNFLDIFFNHLAIGGRVVIMSFHSLEDRMVKHRFRALKQEGVANVLTKRPLTPTEEELRENSRAKPTKLRALERIR